MINEDEGRRLARLLGEADVQLSESAGTGNPKETAVVIDEEELRRLVRLLKEADARLLEGYGNADWQWVLDAQCDIENITRDLCNLVGVTTNQDDVTNRIRAAAPKGEPR